MKIVILKTFGIYIKGNVLDLKEDLVKYLCDDLKIAIRQEEFIAQYNKENNILKEEIKSNKKK